MSWDWMRRHEALLKQVQGPDWMRRHEALLKQVQGPDWMRRHEALVKQVQGPEWIRRHEALVKQLQGPEWIRRQQAVLERLQARDWSETQAVAAQALQRREVVAELRPIRLRVEAVALDRLSELPVTDDEAVDTVGTGSSLALTVDAIAIAEYSEETADGREEFHRGLEQRVDPEADLPADLGMAQRARSALLRGRGYAWFLNAVVWSAAGHLSPEVASTIGVATSVFAIQDLVERRLGGPGGN